MRRTASAPAAWVASRVAAQGLEFGAWVLLARELGASGVGVLAVASIIARMLGLIGDWGAAFRGPRDVVVAGRDSPLVRALVRRRQVVSVTLTALMLLGVGVSGNLAVAPMVVTVLARGCGRDWIALGESRRLDAALPLLVQGTLVCTAVLFTPSIFFAACAIAFGHGAGLLLSLHLNPVSGGRGVAEVAVDSWYLIAGLADQALVSSDTILIVAIQSSVEAGIYASVYRLPLAWLTVIGLCTAAAVPMAAEAVRSRRVESADAHRYADRAAIVGAIATIPVTAVAVVVLVPLFGEDFAAGRDALLILFVATFFTTASAPYRVLYTAFASDRVVAMATVVAAGVNVAANLAVIGRWGIEGAAATTLLTQFAMFVFFAGWSRSVRAVSYGDTDIALSR